MASKQINISGKSLSIFLLILLIGVCSFGYWKYQDIESQISWLESENYDLNERIENLENEKDELQSELDEAIDAKEKIENLYDELSTTFDNYLESKSSYSSYNSSNYYNDYNSTSYSNNYNTSTNIPTTLSTQYFDGGYIIKPSFENLHCLMNMTSSEFISKMSSNNYSLTTDRESYVSNGATNCCYTIDKEYNFVSMIFTKSIQSNIENIMSESNINYIYDNGFKKYNYRLNNQSYELNIQSKYDGLMLVLKKI